MTEAAIALFERLTARQFTRSGNSPARSWSANKTQAGRLIRLFGGAIEAMVRACEYDRDPFDVLDEEIGWDRLVASREEIAALGDLATQDPLSLATQRYAQLRRFAPATSFQQGAARPVRIRWHKGCRAAARPDWNPCPTVSEAPQKTIKRVVGCWRGADQRGGGGPAPGGRRDIGSPRGSICAGSIWLTVWSPVPDGRMR